MLRLTHDAPSVSLVRSALHLVGPGSPEKAPRRVGAGVANVAARRITRVGRSARIPILHCIEGVLYPRSLYILGCAQGADGAPRALSTSLGAQLRD